MIYQNYYLTSDAQSVFQKRGSSWVKRKKGSSDKWLVAPFNEQSALQDAHGDRFLFKYNLFYKTTLLAAVLYAGFKGWQLYKNNQSTSIKSNSPT